MPERLYGVLLKSVNSLEKQELQKIEREAVENKLSSISGDTSGPAPKFIRADMPLFPPKEISEEKIGIPDPGLSEPTADYPDEENLGARIMSDEQSQTIPMKRQDEQSQTTPVKDGQSQTSPVKKEDGQSQTTEMADKLTQTGMMKECPKCSGYFPTELSLQNHIHKFHSTNLKRSGKNTSVATNKRPKRGGVKRKISEMENSGNPRKVKVVLNDTDKIEDLKKFGVGKTLPKGRKKKDIFKQKGGGGAQMLDKSWIFDKSEKRQKFKKWV